MSASIRRTGGQLVVDQLLLHEATIGFCVPGESYLPVLDALVDHADEFRLICARHEGAAANMAAAHGQLTDRPGICFVSRAPGAAHAAVGVHTAAQNSSPMLLLIGQIPTTQIDTEAFQEINYRQMFRGVAKWVTQVEIVDRIPEVMARAFYVSMSGRPGPVVVAIPEDILAEVSSAVDAHPTTLPHSQPTSDDIDRIRLMLAESVRPMVIIGGGGWDIAAGVNLAEWVEAHKLPVVAAFRRQDILDNRSPSYVGTLGTASTRGLLGRVRSADLVIALGTRLDNKTIADTSILGGPDQRFVHVHPDADALGRIVSPQIAVSADVGPSLVALLNACKGLTLRWSGWTSEAREAFVADAYPQDQPGGVNLGHVMRLLRAAVPDDTVITNAAGNYAGWVQRHFEFRHRKTQLAPQGGAMGYGVPAAISAATSGRRAVCITGDGDFMMYPQELATIAEHGLPVIIIVVNNASYGSIRMHQEQVYPGRQIGTDLHNPDFIALADAFRIPAERVTHTSQFGEVLVRTVEKGGPALIELVTSPDALTTRMTLSALRDRAAELSPSERAQLIVR